MGIGLGIMDLFTFTFVYSFCSLAWTRAIVVVPLYFLSPFPLHLVMYYTMDSTLSYTELWYITNVHVNFSLRFEYRSFQVLFSY